MVEKMGRVGVTIIACLAIWFSVAMVDIVTVSGWVRDIAVLAAFAFTVILWLVLALPNHDAEARKEALAATREKAKREAANPTGADPRLALLLELMDNDERRDLKARLIDDLSADGEISLADLLDAQESNAAVSQEDA